MKPFFALFVLAAFWLYPAFAQDLTIQKGVIEHNDQERRCLQVNVNPEPKTLKEAWKDYLQDHHDFKLKGIGFLANKDLLTAEQVVVEAISPKEMDFYTHIVEDENGSEMKVFAAYGYDIYISEEDTPQEYAALRDILENFLETYLPKYYNELIEETKERIEDLTDERDDIKESIADDREEIEELKEDIQELNNNLESNESKLQEVEAKLQGRKAKLKKVQRQINGG